MSGSVLRFGVVAAGVLVVAAACTGPSKLGDAQGAPATPATSGPVTSPSASTPTVAGTATAAGGSKAPACRTDDMVVRLGKPTSAMMQEGAAIELANTGPACTMSGFLGLGLLDDRGAPMRSRVETFNEETAVPPFVVVRGGRAYATLVWFKYEGEGTTCKPFPASLTVSLPGQSATATVPWFTDDISASVCGGRLMVDPLRPTRDPTAR